MLRKAERLECLMPPLPPRLDKELTELGGPDEEAACVECVRPFVALGFSKLSAYSAVSALIVLN